MFKKVEPPKPPKNWNAHVTGEVKFNNKSRYTHIDAVFVEIKFKAMLTKGDKSFELDLTASGSVLECQYEYNKEAFYKQAVRILQNRKGELDMALKKILEDRIKYYFKCESEKSHRAQFEELIKNPIHIKMDIKIKDEDVFQ